MLPLSLLRTAQGHPILVELKNGETYNGNLVSCDTRMNINLRKVIHTSRDGDKFWRIPECYIRGNTIKYLCIPDEVVDMVQEETQPAGSKDSPMTSRGGRGRGARGGSSRGLSERGGRGSERGGRGGGQGRGSDRGGRGGGERGRGRGGRGGRGG